MPTQFAHVSTLDCLIGRRVMNWVRDEIALTLYLDNGDRVVFDHDQECCETVFLHEIVGDLDTFKEEPIITAEIVTNDTDPCPPSISWDESQLWTFYKLRSNRESVTISWFGQSNGYYSIDVSIYLDTSLRGKTND